MHGRIARSRDTTARRDTRAVSFDECVQRADRSPDRRRRYRVAVGKPPGQAKVRTVVDRETGIAAMINVDNGVSAVLRNKRTRNHDILAAGTGEPGHLPALMVDREIAARNKKRAEFGAVTVIRDDTAEEAHSQ